MDPQRAARMGACLLIAVAVTGCGGGKGASTSARDVTRAREIATTRLTRTSLAVAGLGRNVLTRSPGVHGSRRASMIASILTSTTRGRAVRMGYDHDTELYYILNTNADGSGSQLLFKDEAHQIPGGSFTWAAPVWTNNKPNTYPAVIHVTFSVTAGPYAGSDGTLDITLKDAASTNCIIHIALHNLKKEHCSGDFNVVNDVFTGNCGVILTDGSTGNETETEQPDGTINCQIDWPDGSNETLDVQPDGTTSATITDPSGAQTTGDVQPDGSNTISYSDGSSEQSNDNTSNEDGSSDNSGDNSGDRSARVRGVVKRR